MDHLQWALDTAGFSSSSIDLSDSDVACGSETIEVSEMIDALASEATSVRD